MTFRTTLCHFQGPFFADEYISPNLSFPTNSSLLWRFYFLFFSLRSLLLIFHFFFLFPRVSWVFFHPSSSFVWHKQTFRKNHNCCLRERKNRFHIKQLISLLFHFLSIFVIICSLLLTFGF
ncbi:uncharacterized protein BYT42DRAFT_378349 [Radiomyces spectabilis]|uniref:uncharacterized protein n=1 Tax=Radiomyces spectabilis TaxID=64574 RepID=UPI00221EB17D|nr:uncharacterized protein BYT42DRAFT_378349 [Radiomyces spectabilis]KAI8376210.1 hypothetical protein BYT42DRAFT_378349 [Radiomyces spectabilis]